MTTENKPTEITAAEFVEQDYAAKIAMGECEVFDTIMNEQNKIDTIYIEPESIYIEPEYRFHFSNVTNEGDTHLCVADDKFIVRWNDITPIHDAADADYSVIHPVGKEGFVKVMTLTEYEALICERDLRGQFLDRVVSIRQTFNTDSNSWLDSIDAIERQLAALIRELDKKTTQLRLVQDFRDSETERFAQAYENYIKVARLVNRFASDSPALKAAWDELQPQLHQSLNEGDKVAAKVSMLTAENAALKAVNGRLERECDDLRTQLAAAPPTVDADLLAASVSDKMPNDELIDKILHTLGVDPTDWSSSLSGIYAAIRSNMQIGEPQMSKIEDWTDAEQIPEDTLTAVMFKLVSERDDLRVKVVENERLRDEWAKSRLIIFGLDQDLKAFQAAATKVIQDCEAGDVEPLGLKALKTLVIETPRYATPQPTPAVDADLLAAVQPFADYLRQQAAQTNDVVFARAGGRESAELTIGDLRKLVNAAAALKAAREA